MEGLLGDGKYVLLHFPSRITVSDIDGTTVFILTWARTAEDFQTLSAGFQIAMTSNKHREVNQMPDNTKVQIPVVGYTGHRMGYKSQNFYGKNYRDCAIMSKMVQKMGE